MIDIYVAIVAGAIGILGTLFGAVITHWLDLRRDRIQREMEARKEIRSKLLDGVSLTAEKHGRAQIPFDGGNSLYFPSEKDSPEQVIEKLQIKISQIDDQEKRENIGNALQMFLENLQRYLGVEEDLNT